MELSAAAEQHIPLAREAAFDLMVANETLPKVCKRYGPITAIVRAEIEGGAPMQTGEVRVVELDDGTVLREQLLNIDRPHAQEYEWRGGLKPPFAWLVRRGHGHWTFTDDGEGTLLRWTYTFELTSPAAWPVGKVTTLLFSKWMQRALERGAQMAS